MAALAELTTTGSVVVFSGGKALVSAGCLKSGKGVLMDGTFRISVSVTGKGVVVWACRLVEVGATGTVLGVAAIVMTLVVLLMIVRGVVWMTAVASVNVVAGLRGTVVVVAGLRGTVVVVAGLRGTVVVVAGLRGTVVVVAATSRAGCGRKVV